MSWWVPASTDLLVKKGARDVPHNESHQLVEESKSLVCGPRYPMQLCGRSRCRSLLRRLWWALVQRPRHHTLTSPDPRHE